MLQFVITGLLTAGFVAAALAGDAAAADQTVVVLDTTLGSIEITLEPDIAPKTVANFLAYVKDGHYDGTIFHRVIPGFMIQGGHHLPNLSETGEGAPILNEATRRLPNDRGTIAMARTTVPHSATDQFFINLKNNENLNHKDSSIKGYGYCVFGRVTAGMDIVDAIALVPTKPVNQSFMNLPVNPVVIMSVKVKKAE